MGLQQGPVLYAIPDLHDGLLAVVVSEGSRARVYSTLLPRPSATRPRVREICHYIRRGQRRGVRWQYSTIWVLPSPTSPQRQSNGWQRMKIPNESRAE